MNIINLIVSYLRNMKTEIKWDSRYSSTMENDDMGRWARVAYAGKFDNMGFKNGKICS